MAEQNAPATTLKRTPLFEAHRELGARLVEFGGWEMPVQYSGILEEHRAVRERAGLFDVSHMGEFRVEGPGALAFLNGLVPNDVSRLAINQALYTQLCWPDGGTVDDLIIYRLGDERYMTVVNAGTLDKDWAWISEHAAAHDDFTLTNISDETALIALQGPLARTILQPLTTTDLDAIAYYHCQPGAVAGIECLISRTGYTGEDGFEMYHQAERAVELWRALLAAGAPHGLLPAGLGARDTLRLEAGYCLYGHELSDDITPLEAGLGWTVKLNKADDFIGKQALIAEKRDGLRRKLIGIELRERGIPRAGYPILRDGRTLGEVTSGTMCPTLGHAAALGFVPPSDAAVGTELAVEIRGKAIPAVVVALPFYKRQH
ncbi:MAG TPA: glycine cleavage system aminomethyltransferase GcvT [Ktedonobacterales bacterium]|nr:glycine cleavage system aminomethyltransferase GcvT [Ktedonobacterales bacterium]